MKKLLALMLIVTLIVSMVCVNVMAVPVETTVWEEDFENIPEGVRCFEQGGSSTQTFKQGNIASLGAKGDVLAAAKRTKVINGEVYEDVIIKVFILDQSVLEDGATYKFVGNVMHKSSGGAKNIKVQPLKDAKWSEYKGSYTKIHSNVAENQWVELDSNEFKYVASEVTSLNIRFCVAGGETTTLDQRLYVDDVRLVKIDNQADVKPTVSGSVFESYELGKTWDFENLSYNELRAAKHDTDQDTDSNGIKYIVNDPTGADNKVLRGVGSAANSTAARNELIGFLKGEEVKGDVYRISYRMYPEGTSTLNIRTGLKGDKVSTSDAANLSKTELVNGTDFVANQWNDISFEITAVSSKSINLFFDQRLGENCDFVISNSFKYIYIDDIKIEFISDGGKTYFQDMATTTRQIRDFEENPVLQNGIDYKSGSTGFGTLSVANEGYNSNYSLKISGREKTTGRYKFLDVFKNAPLGSMWKISAYVKIEGENADKTPIVSLSAMSNETYFDMQIARVEAKTDEWTKVELLYIVSEDYLGNKMDEIAVAQELYGGEDQKLATDTIYIDDLCVEPVNDLVASTNMASRQTKNSNGDNASDPYNTMAVKFSLPSELNEGTIIIVAAYDKDNNLIANDAFAFDGETTSYCYYIKKLSTLEMAKAKVFTFDGTNLSALNTAINLK